jgi:hypothetical protein
MNNPVGVADHPSIIDSIEAELHMAAKYEEQLNLINKYLKGS